MENKKLNLACISLIGELSYLGKHIYLTDTGCTICGCFTVDYDKDTYKNMPKDIPSEYKVEKWDITCERCFEMIDLIKRANENPKNN